MIYQIVFMSNLAGEETRDDLNRILKKAETNNSRDGITGVLLYKNRQFFQVLEGSERDVKCCFERISSDRRHRSIYTLWSKPALQRNFPSWSASMSGDFKMPQEFSGFCEEQGKVMSLLNQDIAGLKCNTTALKFACVMYKKFNFVPLVERAQKRPELHAKWPEVPLDL